jgi:hypothetical protein
MDAVLARRLVAEPPRVSERRRSAAGDLGVSDERCYDVEVHFALAQSSRPRGPSFLASLLGRSQGAPVLWDREARLAGPVPEHQPVLTLWAGLSRRRGLVAVPVRVAEEFPVELRDCPGHRSHRGPQHAALKTCPASTDHLTSSPAQQDSAERPMTAPARSAVTLLELRELGRCVDANEMPVWRVCALRDCVIRARCSGASSTGAYRFGHGRGSGHRRPASCRSPMTGVTSGTCRGAAHRPPRFAPPLPRPPAS